MQTKFWYQKFLTMEATELDTYFIGQLLFTESDLTESVLPPDLVLLLASERSTSIRK
jgi:hypothetical protein